MAWIRWSEDLGNPQTPGRYPVASGGLVEVTDHDIAVAGDVKGRAKFELLDVTSLSDPGKRYRLGVADRL